MGMTPTGPRPPDEDTADAPLRAALRHAPDAVLEAPPELGAAILQRARAAVEAPARPTDPATPTPSRRPAPPDTRRSGWSWGMAWLHAGWAALSRPPVATAMASVLVATTLGLLWRDGLMDDPFEPAAPPPVAMPDPSAKQIPTPRTQTAQAPSAPPSAEAARGLKPGPTTAPAPAATDPIPGTPREPRRTATPPVVDGGRPATSGERTPDRFGTQSAPAAEAAGLPPSPPAPAPAPAPARAQTPTPAPAPPTTASRQAEPADAASPPAAKAAPDTIGEPRAEASVPAPGRDAATRATVAPAAPPPRASALARTFVADPFSAGPVLAALPAQLRDEHPRWTVARDGADPRPADDTAIAWLRLLRRESVAAGAAWEAMTAVSDPGTRATLTLLRDGQPRHRFRLVADAVQWDGPGLGTEQRLPLSPDVLLRLVGALPPR